MADAVPPLPPLPRWRRFIGRVGLGLRSWGFLLGALLVVGAVAWFGWSTFQGWSVRQGGEPGEFFLVVAAPVEPGLGAHRLVPWTKLESYRREHPRDRFALPVGTGVARDLGGRAEFQVDPLPGGGGVAVVVRYRNVSTQQEGEFRYQVRDERLTPLQSEVLLGDRMAISILSGWLAVLVVAKLLGLLLTGVGGLAGERASRDPWAILMGFAQVRWEEGRKPAELAARLRQVGLAARYFGWQRLMTVTPSGRSLSWWARPRLSGYCQHRLLGRWVFPARLRLPLLGVLVQLLVFVLPAAALARSLVLLWQGEWAGEPQAIHEGGMWLLLALLLVWGGVRLAYRAEVATAPADLVARVTDAWSGEYTLDPDEVGADIRFGRRAAIMVLLAWGDVLVLDLGVVAWGFLVLGMPAMVWGVVRLPKERTLQRGWGWRAVVWGTLAVAGAVGLFQTNQLLLQQRGDEVAAAIYSFQAKLGRFPNHLDELVPTFLPDIPLAKWNLINHQFQYLPPSNGKPPLLVATVVPPYLMRVHNFATGQWGEVD